MNVLIVTDLEGISGIDNYRQIFPVYGEPYEEARNYIHSDGEN